MTLGRNGFARRLTPLFGFVAFSSALVLAGSLSACTRSSDGTGQPAPKSSSESAAAVAPIRRLVVSKGGRVGTLTFDKASKASEVTLATEGSGPNVDALKKAWLEISKMPKVTWTKTVVEGSGANRVTAQEAEEYGREHENYPYAVLDTLSRRYGFEVDIER